jgi:hypothetical protein
VTVVHCLGIGALVGLGEWLPSEPFDYAWATFGCNQLHCGSCAQPVRSTVDASNQCRRYACACQTRDEHGLHVLGDNRGETGEFTTRWHCAGHPSLRLPAVLDGIEISDVAPFADIVRRALAAPPFVAPGFETPSFWVQRLFWLLPAAQRARVGQAVAAQLASDDARAASAAIDFFCAIPSAAGGSDVVAVAERDRERLRATLDPLSEMQESLYDRILEAVEVRLAVPPGSALVDPAAVALSRRLVEANEAGTTTILNVASHDPSWFAARAADIVRGRPNKIGAVLEALIHLPVVERANALDELRSINAAAKAAVKRWLAGNPAYDPRRK